MFKTAVNPLGKRHRRLALLTVIVMAWAGYAYSQAQSQSNDEPSPPALVQPVKAMVIGKQVQSLPFAAEIEASRHAQMGFRIPGELRGVYVRMGERVFEGQLLAELDPTDYRLAVQSRQAEFELATIRAERDQRLFAQKLISEDQFDRSQTDRVVAKARLVQAQSDLDDTRIRAPFSGYVSMTFARANEVMAANQVVMSVENNDQVDVSFNLPLQYGQDLRQGGEVNASVVFSGHPGRYANARIKEFASQPDPDTNSYRITLIMPRPKVVNALTGMTAWVELNRFNNAMTPVTLPQGAFISQLGQQAKVWRIDPQHSTLEAIQVELNHDGTLKSGLQSGDRIVTAGANRLHSGQTVRVWERERGI
ncbi:efflux RND transporter periplasmic adaptor subunit [Ferrimonas sp. SCSIO 43195]|uniref:efflux RND transporter periplasmic adaptor subunit n=1 Tax=Ferrimonas sp. SCSIO 43195 TaxID=2822844 RepID=UPI0020750EA6|nr:efflux RND transporter periplasmic adaptor subunit [Ferrimonas sp. SCSIO 43195]USD38871.1 efflux RND transporter periplasmic adaptor subunit [Ferrimonas sp. SCSIO 43195]